ARRVRGSPGAREARATPRQYAEVTGLSCALTSESFDVMAFVGRMAVALHLTGRISVAMAATILHANSPQIPCEGQGQAWSAPELGIKKVERTVMDSPLDPSSGTACATRQGIRSVAGNVDLSRR